MSGFRKSGAGPAGAILAVLVLALATGPARAAEEAKLSEEAERAQKAAEVLRSLAGSEDSEIPEYLLQRARAIAVIPNVVKGAVVIGGHFGKGLVAERKANGEWSDPVFVQVGGASYGFQIGVESTDLVLVFVHPDGLKALLEDKLKLGVDATIAAGPLGREAQAGTNVTLDSAIYSYSRSKGVFAGLSLGGAILDVDRDANRAVYGRKANAKSILNRKAMVPPATAAFHAALLAHVPQKP
jgi:lipid-binding SYLF domain-containing protein